MFKTPYRRLVLVFSFLLALNIQSQAEQFVEDVTVHVDSTMALAWPEVMNVAFEPQEGKVVNLGIRPEASWLKVTLDPSDKERYLQVESPMVDTLYFYQSVQGQLIYGDTTGVAYPFDSRQVDAPSFLFRVDPTAEPTDIYLRIQSGKQVITVLSVNDKFGHLEKQKNIDVLFGAYAGLMLVMFLYNLFVWFSVRDRSYLYYVVYILVIALTQLVLNGYGNQILWPDNTWLGMRSTHYSGVLSGLATIVFARQYLHVKQNAKWLNYLMHFYSISYVVAFIAATIGMYQFSFNLINFCAMFSLILIFGAIYIWRKGYKPALYFLFAWTFFLLGVAVFVMKDYGAVPFNNFTRFALTLGSAMEVVLLSFALADRINQLKREKEKEQEEKLEALQENERIITQQNELLEAKVNERTVELANSNAELNDTLKELKSAQSQLVDAEKMASLGQMTAGIAHELNNPINFVSSNIQPLQRDLNDVFQILDAYATSSPEDPEHATKIAEAKKLSEELEVDFLKQEIEQLLKGISDGASRTAEIVKGLRIFSRLDEDALKKANINECIESTLVILKSNINETSAVVRNLSPDLPEINCYPGKLNQVFMNIIANALQANAASGKPFEERKVEITTEDADHEVLIRIKDNGIGMPEDVKAKIFDPFFTTKDVGQGTGLGLSIVLGIVNAHNGHIQVDSTPGEGTEFIIHLSKAL